MNRSAGRFYLSLCDYFSEYRINTNRINPEQEPYQRAETAAQMQICTILTVTPTRQILLYEAVFPMLSQA